MSYTGRARQAAQEEDGPGEAARFRPPARLRKMPADVHGLPLPGYKSKYYINRPRILMPRQIEVQRKVEVEGGGKISKTRHLGPKPDLNGRNSV